MIESDIRKVLGKSWDGRGKKSDKMRCRGPKMVTLVPPPEDLEKPESHQGGFQGQEPVRSVGRALCLV